MKFVQSKLSELLKLNIKKIKIDLRISCSTLFQSQFSSFIKDQILKAKIMEANDIVSENI